VHVELTDPKRQVLVGPPFELAPARRRGQRTAHLRDATLHLVGRELSTRYRRSALGWLWAVAPPLVQLAVFHFVFTRVVPLDVPNFAVFLLIGILAWNWFSTSVSLATGALERSRDLVLRPGFATSLLPLVAVLVALVDYAIAAPILLVAVALTTGLGTEALLLPLLLAIQFGFAAGLGWALAPAQIFYRDVQHLVGLALILGFWLTPVFYTRDTVPDKFALVYDLNPMAHLVEAQRVILLDGTIPDAGALALVALASVVVAAGGLRFFLARQHDVPDEL
jgi:lipopolysaccharide transport system permease protein